MLDPSDGPLAASFFDRLSRRCKSAIALGSGLIQTQNATMAARTTADKKLIASCLNATDEWVRGLVGIISAT